MRISPILLVVCAFAVCELAACEPNITSNTYYCGEDGLCPEDLLCNYSAITPANESRSPFSFSCDIDIPNSTFVCPTPEAEPNGSQNDAIELSEWDCGVLLEQSACIGDRNDSDVFHFEKVSECGAGFDGLSFQLRFPMGAAPLRAQLLNEAEEVVAFATPCDESFAPGSKELCLEIPELALGSYYIHIELDSSAELDCQGSCAFNRYRFQLSYL